MGKYDSDKYDRERYIPKGYILPNGEMLTKSYARFHDDMAKKYVRENCYDDFISSAIKFERDYILMKVGAIQVMSCGKPTLIYCKNLNDRFLNEAIASYLSYGWDEKVIPNPYSNYTEYIRYHCLIDIGLYF